MIVLQLYKMTRDCIIVFTLYKHRILKHFFSISEKIKIYMEKNKVQYKFKNIAQQKIGKYGVVFLESNSNWYRIEILNWYLVSI